MFTGNGGMSSLQNIEVWFKNQPYGAKTISFTSAPDWILECEKDQDEKDGAPQSFIDLTLIDGTGLKQQIERFMEFESFGKPPYVDITAYSFDTRFKISSAMVIESTELSLLALGRRVTKINGKKYEIWNPHNKQILEAIKKDPILARFLDLMEEDD
jgi:hypothetical protein